MRNLFKLANLFTLLVGLAIATSAGAVTDNLFPRPFQYAGVRSSGWPLLYYTNNTPTGSYPPLTQPLDEDAIRAYARYPLVCLDMQPTFFYRHDIIEKIKEINPNCKVLVYILDGHWYPPAGNDPTKDVLYGMATDLVNYNVSSGGKAFLYDTVGAQWVDNYTVNTGNSTVSNIMLAGYKRVLDDPLVDGLFLDCMNYGIAWTTPYNDGVHPVRNLDWVKAGYSSLQNMDDLFYSEANWRITQLRANYPTKIFATNSGIPQTAANTLSGRMWENWPYLNAGYYPVTWANINSANLSELSYYSTYKVEVGEGGGTYPEIALSSIYGLQATAKSRYVLGSAALGEGWATYANNRWNPTYTSGPNIGKYAVPSGSLWWYDEYSVNVTPGLEYATADTTGAHTFWLGKAKTAAIPVTSGAANGLWYRKFENGVVLVNPTGGTLTYTSDVPLKRIKGIRDTTVNDGSYGYTFNVPYQSALFLVNAIPPLLATGITAVKVRPNMTSAAVSAWVQGDADTNATLQIFYRRFNAAAYDSGMVMVPRRGHKQDVTSPQYSGTNYEGRILHLARGRKYQYYLRLTERTAAGYTNIDTAADTFSVLRIPTISVDGNEFLPMGGIHEGGEDNDPDGGGVIPPAETLVNKIYVRQSGGSDDNDGLTWGTAFKTIGAAVSYAQLVEGNPSILVYPGHYHEKVNLNWGTTPVNTRRYFLGISSTPDSVVICGANPLYESGMLTSTRKIIWFPVGAGVYRTYFPDSSCRHFIIGSERLVRKTNQYDLATSTHGYHGWYWTNDTLYVKLNNSLSPVGRKLYFGAQQYGVNCGTGYWRISNIRFQYQGWDSSPTGSGADMHYQGYGVSMGLNGSATNTIIDHCKFIGQGQFPIYAARGGGGVYNVDNTTVIHNYIDGMFTDKYDAGKTRTDENLCVFLNGSRTIFNYNTVLRTFNGVQPTDETTMWTLADSTLASWSEVTNNTFKLITDDAIELDSYQVINRLIEYNTIDSCGRAISFSPMTINGPAFVFYNRITNCEAGLKVGGDSFANGVFYHNTIIGKIPIYNPGGVANNMTFRNNIFWGRNTSFTMDFGPGFSAWYTSTFNYNVYDSTATTAMINYLGVIPTSFLGVRVFQPDFERNGKHGTIGIQSLARGDYRLRWPSNAIDTGCTLPGVNTSDRGKMYYIKPDMGCYEFVPANKKGP